MSDFVPSEHGLGPGWADPNFDPEAGWGCGCRRQGCLLLLVLPALLLVLYLVGAFLQAGGI